MYTYCNHALDCDTPCDCAEFVYIKNIPAWFKNNSQSHLCKKYPNSKWNIITDFQFKMIKAVYPNIFIY